jgi:DNA-nicking Smr family endonuclease
MSQDQSSDGVQPGDPAFDLPIDGVLDLHTFRPKDVKDVVMEYLCACRAKGIYEVRVIHGKGIGQLRQTVHSVLRRLPEVESFDLAGEAWGGTGATIVHLKRRD